MSQILRAPIHAPFRSLALLGAVLLLSACAATVQRPAAAPVDPVAVSGDVRQVAIAVEGSDAARGKDDWADFRALWPEAMRASASAAGLQSSDHAGRPTSLDPPGVLVVVRIDDYRYVSTGARYGLGVMTGNAYIKATAEFVQYPGGQVVATRSYDTTSSAWQGIFAPMTTKQVQAITDQIVAEVRGGG
ncbi:hypothetical protein LDO26_16680 [Luteimonas sp. BDR2-5]|uniref:hypothetical protein n=1 Tax=Proluteimonas luteida TaxID=2878685 RepID=UPI001E40AC32|nr:hypothetical protein [Luteimonas sp. BDR2-5]MCD9029828.1 hypothetical protein [Luteimonas sp. BDR2-5]